MAVTGGQLKFARMLLKHNAEVNARSDSDSTPLHHAASGGHLELARLLLKHNAEINAETNVGSPNGSTPLQQAASEGHLELVRMLLGHNANSQCKDGWTSAAPCGDVGTPRVSLNAT